MFDKIKHDIEQDYYREHYPNDGQRFIAWYLRNIHNLDIHEAKDCITDGAGDKQIDAIYIDNQSSTIYIMQGNSMQAARWTANRFGKFCQRGYKLKTCRICKRARIRS